MAKNLVNGTNIVIEENGDNINMNLSSAYTTNLQQEINDSFKENNTYSTTETVVGTWTDNKPIYRKVIRNNVIGTAVNHGILNIDEITDIKLIVLQQSGLYSPQNSDSIYMGDTNYIVYLKTTNVLNYKIIVEYTKTTD